jgi:hypothetical protein
MMPCIFIVVGGLASRDSDLLFGDLSASDIQDSCCSPWGGTRLGSHDAGVPRDAGVLALGRNQNGFIMLACGLRWRETDADFNEGAGMSS